MSPATSRERIFRFPAVGSPISRIAPTWPISWRRCIESESRFRLPEGLLMRSREVVFDVTAATGLDEPPKVAGTLHLPDPLPPPSNPGPLLCLHGRGLDAA